MDHDKDLDSDFQRIALKAIDPQVVLTQNMHQSQACKYA